MTPAERLDTPGLDGDPGEHRCTAAGAIGDARCAARSVRPVWRSTTLRRAAQDDRDETRLEDAYWAAIEALEGFPLFTMTQAQRLIGYFGDYKTGEWSDMARHTVAKNAYRLRERSDMNNRIAYRNRKEIVYARRAEEQKRWHAADKEMVMAALDRTEEQAHAQVCPGAAAAKSTSRRG